MEMKVHDDLTHTFVNVTEESNYFTYRTILQMFDLLSRITNTMQ